MKERKDAAFKKAAVNWKKAKKAAGPLIKDLEEAKGTLLGLLGEESVFGFGVTALRKRRVGSVDYGAIPQLKGLDLDEFRKPDVEFFELTASDA